MPTKRKNAVKLLKIATIAMFRLISGKKKLPKKLCMCLLIHHDDNKSCTIWNKLFCSYSKTLNCIRVYLSFVRQFVTHLSRIFGPMSIVMKMTSLHENQYIITSNKDFAQFCLCIYLGHERLALLWMCLIFFTCLYYYCYPAIVGTLGFWLYSVGN